MIPLRKFSIRGSNDSELRIQVADVIPSSSESSIQLPLPNCTGTKDSSFASAGELAPKLSFEEDETKWDILEPLRLLENVDYEFAVSIQMNRAEFDARRRTNDNTVFPFENLKLQPSISFNTSDWCRVLNESHLLVTGRLRFDNQLGGVDLSLSGDISNLQLRAEVTTNKLNYEQDFRILLKQLSEIHSELMLQLDAPTEVALKVADTEPSQHMVLLHLRRLFDGGGLSVALATILGSPMSRQITRNEVDATAFVTEPDWMQLQVQPTASSWISGGPLAATFSGMTPETLPTRSVQNSLDTIENRYVKYSLGQLIDLIVGVRRKLKRGYKATHKKLSGWEATLNDVLLHPMWQVVGDCKSLPNSMVMYERHGYRDYMQGLMLLELGMLFESDFGVLEQSDGDLKAIWELYEIWCYFQLRNVLAEITESSGSPPLKELIHHKNFSAILQSGESGCTSFEHKMKDRAVQMNLYYHKSFGPRKAGESSEWANSYSTNFLPDFSIEFLVEEMNHWIHFDAKYRVAFGRSKTENSNGGVVRTERSEDIDQMHMYRDAILGTRGSFVLYPGSKSEERIFVRHSNAEYRDKFPCPSVGAFPLCPGKGSIQARQLLKLKEYLNSCIVAAASCKSYSEEEGFRI